MSVVDLAGGLPGRNFRATSIRKIRGTSDQDALAAQLLPQRLGARDDAVEIGASRFVVFAWLMVALAALRELSSERRRQLLESDGKFRHVIDHRLRDAGGRGQSRKHCSLQSRVP
jgi:hypothetical protein